MIELTKEEMTKKLHDGVWEVCFVKQNGTPRTFNCTLDSKYLPKTEPKEGAVKKAEPSTDAIRVFEVDLEAWRSFNASHVESFTWVSA
jgi:hypothetical protein